MSMVLVLLAGDAFSFLLFWEIMAVASFMLVNHESEKRATWNAAYQYLVMTSVGTAAIMIALLLTGSASEASALLLWPRIRWMAVGSILFLSVPLSVLL